MKVRSNRRWRYAPKCGDLVAGVAENFEQHEAIAPSRVHLVDELVEPRLLLLAVDCIRRARGHVFDRVERDVARPLEDAAKPPPPPVVADRVARDRVEPARDVLAVEPRQLALD